MYPWFFKQKEKNKGFSLVELLIALLIMAVIAGTAVTMFVNILEASKVGADKETADAIRRALLTYITASNDVNLNCLGVATGEDSAAVVNALSKKTVITESGATNDGTPTTWSADALPGYYGPFLDSADITPKQKGMVGWKIELDSATSVITVKYVNAVPDATITIN